MAGRYNDDLADSFGSLNLGRQNRGGYRGGGRGGNRGRGRGGSSGPLPPPLFPDIRLENPPRLEGSRGIELEGCENESNKVEFVVYRGDCHVHHRDNTKYVPRLMKPSTAASTYPAEEFFRKRFWTQLEKLKRHAPAEEEYMRLIVRFGKIYLFEKREQVFKCMTVENFNKIADDTQKGFPVGRSFIPSDVTSAKSHIEAYLDENGFEKSQAKLTYKVEITYCHQPRATASLTLNESLVCEEISYDGIRWCNVDIKRKDDSKFDIRFMLESKWRPSTEVLFDKIKDKTILERRGDDLVVGPFVRKYVTFVRKKNTTVFVKKAEESAASDESDIKIEFSNVVEYANPTDDGRFGTKKNPRNEITIKVKSKPSKVFDPESLKILIENFMVFSCKLEEEMHRK